MGDPLGGFQVADQELASPDVPVITKPGPVETHPDHLFIQSVLCEHRGYMGMVMLYRQGGKPELPGKTGREVIRVKVMHGQRRFKPEQAFKTSEGLPVEIVSFKILQIADVLAQDRLPSLSHGKTVHQFGPCREDPLGFQLKPYGIRDISPGAP